MLWIMVIIGVVIVIGGILGGMGFIGSSSRDRRGSSGNNFIDWMF